MGYFRGENFCKFHKSKTVCENFTLEILRYSLQSMMISENFPFEKLGIVRKFSASKITCYMVAIKGIIQVATKGHKYGYNGIKHAQNGVTVGTAAQSR